MPTMFGYMLEKIAIDEALEKALATPIEKKVADMMANSHEYKKPNIQGALTFVKNYTWEERTIPLSRLQGINKPIKKDKVFEIAKTLEKNGDAVEWPFIVVNKLHGIRPQTHGKVVLMDGHHRMEACKARGIKEVPVYFGVYTGGAEIEDDELYKEVPNEKVAKDYSEKLKNLRVQKDPDNIEQMTNEEKEEYEKKLSQALRDAIHTPILRKGIDKKASTSWKRNLANLGEESMDKIKRHGLMDHNKYTEGLERGNEALIKKMNIKELSPEDDKAFSEMVYKKYNLKPKETFFESAGENFSVSDKIFTKLDRSAMASNGFKGLDDSIKSMSSPSNARMFETVRQNLLNDKEGVRAVDAVVKRHEIDELRSLNKQDKRRRMLVDKDFDVIMEAGENFTSHASPDVLTQESRNITFAPKSARDYMNKVRVFGSEVGAGYESPGELLPSRALSFYKNMSAPENFGAHIYGKSGVYDKKWSNKLSDAVYKVNKQASDADSLEKLAEELIEKKIVTQDDLHTVARIVHEINRHYNKLLMDREDPSWDELDEKDKENRISLLSATVPDIKTISAKKMHDMWVDQQAREGWIHGECYDSKKKTHPCIVPWKELPELEKAKDAMYLAVIKAMTELHFGIDKTIDSKIKEVKIPGGEKVLMNKSASMFRQLLEKQAGDRRDALKALMDTPLDRVDDTIFFDGIEESDYEDQDKVEALNDKIYRGLREKLKQNPSAQKVTDAGSDSGARVIYPLMAGTLGGGIAGHIGGKKIGNEMTDAAMKIAPKTNLGKAGKAVALLGAGAGSLGSNIGGTLGGMAAGGLGAGMAGNYFSPYAYKNVTQEDIDSYNATVQRFREEDLPALVAQGGGTLGKSATLFGKLLEKQATENGPDKKEVSKELEDYKRLKTDWVGDRFVPQYKKIDDVAKWGTGGALWGAAKGLAVGEVSAQAGNFATKSVLTGLNKSIKIPKAKQIQAVMNALNNEDLVKLRRVSSGVLGGAKGAKSGGEFGMALGEMDQLDDLYLKELGRYPTEEEYARVTGITEPGQIRKYRKFLYTPEAMVKSEVRKASPGVGIVKPKINRSYLKLPAKNATLFGTLLEKEAMATAWKKNLMGLGDDSMKKIKGANLMDPTRYTDGLERGNEALIKKLNVEEIRPKDYKRIIKMIDNSVEGGKEVGLGKNNIRALQGNFSLSNKILPGLASDRPIIEAQGIKGINRLVKKNKRSMLPTSVDEYLDAGKNIKSDKESVRAVNAILKRHELDEVRAINSVAKKGRVIPNPVMDGVNMSSENIFSHFSPEVVAKESRNVTFAPHGAKKYMNTLRRETGEISIGKHHLYELDEGPVPAFESGSPSYNMNKHVYGKSGVFDKSEAKKLGTNLSLLNRGLSSQASLNILTSIEKQAAELGKRSLQQTNNIRTSAEAGRMLELKYKDKSGNVSTRFVEPYKLTDDDFWGYDPEQGGIRRFKIKNIKAVKKTTKAFTPQWPIETSPIQKVAMATAVQKRYNESQLSDADAKRAFTTLRHENPVHDRMNSRVKRIGELGEGVKEGWTGKKYERLSTPNNIRHAPPIDPKRQSHYIGRKTNEIIEKIRSRYGEDAVKVNRVDDMIESGIAVKLYRDQNGRAVPGYTLNLPNSSSKTVRGKPIKSDRFAKELRAKITAHETLGELSSMENIQTALERKNLLTGESIGALQFGTHAGPVPVHVDAKFGRAFQPATDQFFTDMRKGPGSLVSMNGSIVSQFDFLKDVYNRPDAKTLKDLVAKNPEQLRQAATIIAESNKSAHGVPMDEMNKIIKAIIRKV